MITMASVLRPARAIPAFAFFVAIAVGIGALMANQPPYGGGGGGGYPPPGGGYPPQGGYPPNPQFPGGGPNYGPQGGYPQPAPPHQPPRTSSSLDCGDCDCSGCTTVDCIDCASCVICDLDCLSTLCTFSTLKLNLSRMAPSGLVLIAPLVILSMWRRRLVAKSKALPPRMPEENNA